MDLSVAGSPRLPVCPVAGLGSSCLPVASHTDTQMQMALSSSWSYWISCWPTLRALLYPVVTWITPMATPTLPPEHLLLAGWSGLMFSRDRTLTHTHTNAHSVSPDIAILMHQPWWYMVFPQLLHLDFCLLTGPRRREPLTHEKSCQWSLMRRWDRLCWSGAGCGQTSAWTKWQFIDTFYLIFPLVSCTFSYPTHHGWIPRAWTVR